VAHVVVVVVVVVVAAAAGGGGCTGSEGESDTTRDNPQLLAVPDPASSLLPLPVLRADAQFH
jgi:hypothetical protein